VTSGRAILGDVRRALLCGWLVLGCGPAAVAPPYPGDNAAALVADNPACAPGNTCAAGRQCTILVTSDGDRRVCLPGDACELLQCPADWTCLTQTSLPGRVSCAYFQR
jgi:hypothetical protein